MNTAEVLTPVPTAWPDADGKDHYEIIDGQRVEMPPMSADSTGLAADLAHFLTTYGLRVDLGKAYPEMLIKLPLPIDRNRRPDVIFVPFTRWPKGRSLPATNEWAILPEVCVEVVSPNDLTDELATKTAEYFQAGVRQVWVVYPRHGLFYVYESPTQVRGLTRDDTLDGGSVLPGFTLKLADLFPAPESPTGS